jgi:ferredoxin
MPSEPQSFQVTFLLPNAEERTIAVGGEEHIWDAASTAGITLPALCHQGYCLTCAARLENGGQVDQSDSLMYFPADREAGFVLLCTGKPRSDLRVRTHQAKQMRQFRKQSKLIAPYSWAED